MTTNTNPRAELTGSKGAGAATGGYPMTTTTRKRRIYAVRSDERVALLARDPQARDDDLVVDVRRVSVTNQEHLRRLPRAYEQDRLAYLDAAAAAGASIVSLATFRAGVPS